LISRAVPAAELASMADDLIAKLSGLSAPVLHLCKQALRLGGDGWASRSSIEKLYLEELMSTADAHEGLAAFMEKRPPNWTHH
jgi:enoyl-CoA hydratase/carnithine racemase